MCQLSGDRVTGEGTSYGTPQTVMFNICKVGHIQINFGFQKQNQSHEWSHDFSYYYCELNIENLEARCTFTHV